MVDRTISEALRLQAQWCRQLDSPLTAALLDAAAADFDLGGIVHKLLADFPLEPVGAALALRLAGALHHAVLTGQAEALAPFYPSVGGLFDEDRDTVALWTAVRDSLNADPAAIRDFIRQPPQTNEVTRSGVLLGGFLTLAQRCPLPLNLREVGASAGLNLLFDHYHYRLGSGSWGDPASPVHIHSLWQGAAPSLSALPPILSRAACDQHPLALATPAQRRRLEAYVWPDQAARLQRLRAAMSLAQELGVEVEAISADVWITRELAELPAEALTVVYHSVVEQYLPKTVRTALQQTLEATGRRASAAAPLAYLTMEPRLQEGSSRYLLELTLWPGGQRQTLAEVHPHGNAAQWFAA